MEVSERCRCYCGHAYRRERTNRSVSRFRGGAHSFKAMNTRSYRSMSRFPFAGESLVDSLTSFILFLSAAHVSTSMRELLVAWLDCFTHQRANQHIHLISQSQCGRLRPPLSPLPSLLSPLPSPLSPLRIFRSTIARRWDKSRRRRGRSVWLRAL